MHSASSRKASRVTISEEFGVELCCQPLPAVLLFQFRELMLGVQGEGSILNPAELRTFRVEDFPDRLALVLSEIDHRLSGFVADYQSGEIHGALVGIGGKRSHIVL